MNSTLTWPLIRARLQEAVLVLPHFFRNPAQFMRNLPAWEWPEMLILQAAFAAICSVLTNALSGHLLAMILGIVLGPITQLLLVAISAAMFFYIFKFYFHREVPYRQIYIHIVFAAIPSMVCNILSPIFPPSVLIGAVGTALLLYIGFTDNFHLDRKRIRNLLGALYTVLFLSMIFQIVTFANKHERLRQKATPESMDILEKEMNLDN